MSSNNIVNYEDLPVEERLRMKQEVIDEFIEIRDKVTNPKFYRLEKENKKLENELKLTKTISKALVPEYYVKRAWNRGVIGGFALGFALTLFLWSLISSMI